MADPTVGAGHFRDLPCGEDDAATEEADRYSLLLKKYTAIIARWNWRRAMHCALSNIEQDDDGEPVARVFIGSVFSLYPSGKYYMPWACSNVTEAEAEQDEAYREALEDVSGAHGMWAESGEGDPTDIFLACRLPDVLEGGVDHEAYALYAFYLLHHGGVSDTGEPIPDDSPRYEEQLTELECSDYGRQIYEWPEANAHFQKVCAFWGVK